MVGIFGRVVFLWTIVDAIPSSALPGNREHRDKVVGGAQRRPELVPLTLESTLALKSQTQCVPLYYVYGGPGISF